MTAIVLAVSMTLASAGWAQQGRTYPVPPGVDIPTLAKELQARSFRAVVKFENGKPFVVLDAQEAKDPAPVIESLIDLDTKLMRSLAGKWEAGTITPAEKDQLLLLLVKRFLGL